MAVLQDTRMSEPEALQSIAAIAEWVRDEAPGDGADCGDVIRRLNALTARIDHEAISDREAEVLFDQVFDLLKASPADG